MPEPRRLPYLTIPALVAFAACVAREPGVPVGPEEVEQDLVGKVWRVELPDGHAATEWLNANGSVVIRGGLNDAGRWRLWKKGYCTAWQRMRQGAERCFTLDRTASGQYRIYKPDGTLSMTILGFEGDAGPPP
jgi:hypothetical protein